VNRQHDRSDDEQAVGDVEIGPSVLAVAKEDPIPNTTRERLWQIGHVHPIVEIA